MSLRRWRTAILILALFPALAMHAYDYAADSTYTARFSDRAVIPIEGIWTIDEGATLMIVADAQSKAEVYIIDSPDLRLHGRHYAGTATPIDSRGKHYRLNIATEMDSDGILKNPHIFEATLTDDNVMMTLEPKRALRLDLWMLYRLYFTASVRREKAPNQLRAHRIVPVPPPTPNDPVVL